VASREVRERARGKIFRVGTVLILAVVAGAIVIPTLGKGGKTTVPPVGVVGSLDPALGAAVVATGPALGVTVKLVPEADLAAADRALRAGRVSVVIVDTRRLMVDAAISPSDGSITAQLVGAVAQTLGTDEAYISAGLTTAQAETVAGAKPLPVASLTPAPKGKKFQSTSIIGVILIFVMLNQYLTWTLIGVMEEKSSRVIEVLLAAVRPIQLLTGKVLGIGLMAMAQATLILVFAVSLSSAVGSDLLKGTGPGDLLASLVWLMLGYGFYCWVYAAAGSMAARQEQVQSLAFPLALPMLFGYIMALTTAGTGNASTLFKVLAYLPPTAPFAMPVLVGLGQVTWWEFTGSALLSIGSTVFVARFAARIYRRAILRTGRGIRLRDAFSGTA
jgi:ABC-2 type transport system permease protein